MTAGAAQPHDCCVDNGEPAGVNATLHEPISASGTPETGLTYTVPARNARAVRLLQGQVITLINPHGTQVCDLWAFSAADLSEFLSMEHVRAWIDRVTPRAGDPLVSNRRRPILTMLSDSSPGVHDTLIAPCDIDRYRTLGVKGYHDNCADNLRLALKAIGLRTATVPCAFNLWMNIPVGVDQSLQWLAPVSQPGDSVQFRAEMDCIVVMSACPQDIIKINANHPREIRFVVDTAARPPGTGRSTA